MSDSLHSLSDHDLLRKTRALVAKERGITLEVLVHLNEVEQRKLYLELGYSSMFDYCTRELGYSASAASRRIRTARCVAKFPPVLDLLRANDVNLSTVSQVSKVLNADNSGAILSRIRGKSQREVEAIVAEFEPLAVLPKDRIRTVVVRVPLAQARAQEQRREAATPLPELVEAGQGAHTNEYNRNGRGDDTRPDRAECPGGGIGAESKDAPRLPEIVERRTVVQFTADDELMTILERVRLLASHRLSANPSIADILKLIGNYYLKHEDPIQRHDRREARGETARAVAPSKTSSARTLPSRLRDQVFVRDRGQCQYIGANGKRCGSGHVVQIDHITPVARGGASVASNLRLLCAYHNRLEAQRLMGRSGPPGMVR
jgi:5-methylcytosine-specific restriction endonuclease McrA